MFSGGITPPSSTYPVPAARAGAVRPADPAASETPAGTQTLDEGGRASAPRLEQARLLLERVEIAELATRDREVRAHEQAHASVGGALAGSPSYSYTRGPDGRRYVTGGEVSIDTSPVTGNPQATLQKMEQVRRAALAPAEPSGQDLLVAAQAQAVAAQARGELTKLNSAERPVRDATEPEEKSAALDLYRGVQEGAGAASGLVDETV